MTATADLIVLGSGIAGASVAFAAARRGLRVTVVDDQRAGRATAAGAGIIEPWSSALDGERYALYAAGAAFYPELLDALADAGEREVGYRRVGALVVSTDETQLRAALQRTAARAADAPLAGAVERLTDDELRDAFPPIAPGLAGFRVEGGARLDGRLLAAALLSGSQRLGATVRAGTVELPPAGGASSAVHVLLDGERVDGERVVVAGGAWSGELLARRGIELDVAPERGQIIHFGLPGVDTSHWPTVLPIADHYLVCFDGGRVVAGATRERDAGFDPRLTAAGVRQVIDDALSIAPGLAGATLLECRVGLRPRHGDLHPLIGALDDSARWSVVTGFGAIGLTIGPVVGDLLVRRLLGEDAALIAAFAPGQSTPA